MGRYEFDDDLDIACTFFRVRFEVQTDGGDPSVGYAAGLDDWQATVEHAGQRVDITGHLKAILQAAGKLDAFESDLFERCVDEEQDQHEERDYNDE